MARGERSELRWSPIELAAGPPRGAGEDEEEQTCGVMPPSAAIPIELGRLHGGAFLFLWPGQGELIWTLSKLRFWSTCGQAL